MASLPRLDPAVARTRRAVREALAGPGGPLDEAGATPRADGATLPLVLVALSGGADSLALAAAVAFAAPRIGATAGAVVVDHGLQPGSDRVAEDAASAARGLGLDPVTVERVTVSGDSEAGPEGAAREARYAALEAARSRTGARLILTAHTRDDQAEQVLLALARGSGARSLAGIPRRRGAILRPFLDLDRATTEAACAAQGLAPWRDPHNSDAGYARVRVRSRILPVLEAELGPGISAALARTAELAREDADAFDAMVAETIEEIVEPAEAGIAVSVAALAANPPALRHRLIRAVAAAEFGSHLSREHTLAVAALVTAWRGQGPVYVPGIRVERAGGRLVLTRQQGSPREAREPARRAPDAS